ncbi:MAG TPA: nucleotide exchange factor GrpE [Spirochaetota bacterium]|nr:nucleotide exchange factor GrpE [Spirochaetota bacterium]
MKSAFLGCFLVLVLSGIVSGIDGSPVKKTNIGVTDQIKSVPARTVPPVQNQEVSMITWLVMGGLVSILMVLIFMDVKVKNSMQEILNLLRYLSRQGDDASDGRNSTFGKSLQEMASLGQVVSALGREMGSQRESMQQELGELRTMMKANAGLLEQMFRTKNTVTKNEAQSLEDLSAQKKSADAGASTDIQTYLARHEIELINPGVGEIYNALRQEAIEYVDEPGVGENRIVRCKKPGLRYRGRVVAKAEVIVARHES